MKTAITAGLLAATAAIGVTAAVSQTATPAAPAVPRSFGTFGIDTAGMDRSATPGDDFYAFTNGTWAKTTPIPADKSNYGSFDLLADISRERTRALIEQTRADPSSRIGQAYATYLDQGAIEARGLAPVKPWLDRIKALGGKPGYPALLAEADRNGVDGLFGGGVGQDAKDPDVYAVGIRQAGLGLPDRDYYLSADPKQVAARTAYQAHLAKMLTLAGEPDAAPRAAAIVAFETEIARVHWTRVDSRDADKTYNKVAVADLVRTAPGFDFVVWLAARKTPVETVIVGQPSAVQGIARLVAATPLPVLKDQLIVRSLDGYADVLPKAFDDEQFAFYGTVLTGTPQQQERWKRAVDFTQGALTDDVSKLYVARYFPPETKAEADKLVKNVLAAMDARLGTLAWMTPATRAKARAKLAAFTPRIGYPDRWRDYGALEIRPGDAFGNELRAAQWRSDYNTTKLGQPIYRWEWGMTPMTVNAQANFGLVAITFPAAILQPPFFDPRADPAVNYGGIGAVIGHELSHHFDDQGSKFDAAGRLVEWWTPQDVQRFTALTGQLAAQYDAYQALPGATVNGKLTLGENIADLAGLTVAYDAYRRSLGGKPAPVLGGFTGDQRFYMGWAQVWRRNYREAALRQRLLTDSHAPSEQRAAVVRNLDPWYAAYKPQPGQRLYLADQQRVRIW